MMSRRPLWRPALASLICLLSEVLTAAEPSTPGQLTAQVSNSGMDLNHDTWNGLGIASDGKVYYVLCSDSVDLGAQMFSFDPVSGRIRHLGDLTEACGEKGLKAIPQGKSHVRFVEHGGKLYFATHLAYYKGSEGKDAKEKRASPPPGYRPYPGGHFLAYDMARGKFERLASAPQGEGILAMSMDPARGRLYGLTWPTGCFLRYDLAKKDLKQFGPIAGQGEAGQGRTFSTLCRAIVINPDDGSAYLTTAAGDILRYRYDGDRLETVAQDNLRKDYFGTYDPTVPGHMGYNWRQAVWYSAEKTIYAVHGNSGYLFRFDPRIARVEVLERITSEPSRRSGMNDRFRYGYLGFALGPDQRTLYYLTGGPLTAGKKPSVVQSKGPEEDLHLVTYDIPTAHCVDHGAIFLADGQRPGGVHSLDVAEDGTVYALSKVNRNGRTARDLVWIAPLSSTAARSKVRTTIVVGAGRFPTVQAAARAEEQIDWLDADRADDTACTQCFAALELERYLRRMTGRSDDFKVVDENHVPTSGDVILIGRPSAAKAQALAEALGIGEADLAGLGPEGYRVRSKTAAGQRLTFVAGLERVGTLYGVYDLLYRLGCRWFAPGDLGEDVPRIEGLVDLDVRQRPSFSSRGFLAWENRGDRDFLLWMARNRMDYWTLAQEPPGLMHKLGIRMVCGRHNAEEEFLNPAGSYPYRHPAWPAGADKPADPYRPSPDFQGDANGDGQLSYFEAHPEWYAMVKGKRVPGIQGSFGTNYCTSNADATTEFVKNYVQALMDGPYRNAQILRFWTLDGGKWCECEACRAQGAPTDRYLLLVHRFCQELAKARAEGKIHRPIDVTFLAYSDVVDPPTRPLPAAFREAPATATFYPIRRCYVHGFEDPNCPTNARYRGQLAGWAQDANRHYRGPIAIGEYYNVSRFKCLPICFMHTMARDIPAYYRIGARHFDYMHVTTVRWGNKALSNYQMARQLWDIQTGCEALWQDYFTRRYGPAADTMRRFYESLEFMFSNANELKYGLAQRLERGDADLFPKAQLRYRREPGLECEGPTLVEILEHGRQCRQLLDEAQSMSLSPAVRARLAEDEAGFTYGQRTVDYYHACVQAFREARAGHLDQARGHYAEAQRLAEVLRSDTISTQGSSSHANAENAFVATGATGALDQLARLLNATK